MVRTLIWEIAYSIAVPQAKKRLFLFGPYLPFQRYLGCYQEAFEAGVALGYVFRNRLATLAKLFSEPGREQAVVALMQELARTRLAEVGTDKGFLDFAMLPEEHRIKASWQESGMTEPQIGSMGKTYKMPLETAVGNLNVAVSTGIGFRSAFPELTEHIWGERDRPVGRDAWAKYQRMGVVSGEEPKEFMNLAKRQERVLSLVQSFVSKACPELLSQFKTQS